MNARVSVLFLTLATASGCSTSNEPFPEQLTPQVAPSDVSNNVIDLGFRRPKELSNNGQWELKNGSKICHGFLTQVESEDFCAATVPEDWKPFTYDGQTYYIQPLAGS